MIYVNTLFILFFSSILLYLAKVKVRGMFYIIPFLMIFIAGFRDGTFFPDYENYQYAYMFSSERMEPSFMVIREFGKIIGCSHIFLFVIYAILGVSLKIFAIKKISSFLWLSLATYIATSYLLHDLIQIRASVAVGFFLCSIYYLQEKKYKIWGLLTFCAVMFHYASLILFVLPVLKYIKFNRKIWVFLLFCSFISGIFSTYIVNLISYIDISFIQNLFLHHTEVNESKEDTVNVFNIIHLIRCLFVLFLSYNFVKISDYRYSEILMKLYFVGLISFGFLSALPVLAFRVSEIFCVVEIFLIPLIFKIIKNHTFAWLYFMFITCSIMYIQIFYNNFIIM